MKIDMEKLCMHYEIRRSELKQDRSTYEPTWREINDYIAPRSSRFEGELTNDGTRRDQMIINTSPRLAARTLASGMQSGITSPMRPWFKLALPDPDMNEYKPYKLWLSDVERVLRYILSRSNIYDRLKSNYGTLGNYGTSALWVDEDNSDVVRAHDFLTGSFYLSTNAAGYVDTMYRVTTLTTTQMLERFGMEMVSEQVKNAYDIGNYQTKFDVVHLVEPNRNYKPASALSQHKRFASVWYDMTAKDPKNANILKYSGYDDQPFMGPRWDVMGENVYGFGCGEVAIGDCKQLQLMEKRKLQGIDKNVNPPMVADASLRNQRTSVVPNETTYVNGMITGSRPGFAPAYQVNPYLRDLKEEILGVSQRIDEAYFKNLFLMVTEFADQPNITATQINTMREEKLMMLGPVLERLNDELLDPLIDRVFNIAWKRGMLPPPPEGIENTNLRVEYISVMAQAQKAMGIGNIERFVGFVGNVAQMYPEALDKVNIDEVIEEYADGVAVPPKAVRTADEAQEIRAGREQQAQQMQAAQAGVMAADTARTLSETDMTKDSALLRALQTAGYGG